MRIWSFVMVGLVSLGGDLGRSGCAQGYLAKDLGAPGVPGSASEVHGINRDGSAAGTWWPASSIKGSQYAFLYANGTNADLGALKSGGYDFAIAYAVNDSYQAVGQSTTGGFVYHAFLYSNGVMLDLDTTGGSWSSANAVNQQGQIVGEMTASNGSIHACVFTNGTVMDLGTLPLGDYSSAKGINDLGVIVGESAQYTNGVMNIYAFVYSNGVMSNLGTLGGNYSSARAINNAGQIAGEGNTASGETHAFFFSGGVMTDLGTFGGTNSTASAINNSGQVVGYALDPNEEAHAFLFDRGAMLDLNTLLSPAAGWTNVFLTLGYALNDYGQIGISVNWYTNSLAGPVTNYHAVLLTPAIALSVAAAQTDGPFGLRITGPNNQPFVLQGSTDLAHWIPLSTNILSSNILNWADATAPANAQRFYRALMLP
jgi:probable HAF family extracellular repeat protein